MGLFLIKRSKFTLLLCLLIGCGFSTNAQLVLSALTTTDTVSGGALAQVNFLVRNTLSLPVSYVPALQAGRLQQVSRLPALVTVPANDSVVVPVKVYVPKNAAAGSGNSVVLSISSSSGAQYHCTAPLYIKEQQFIYLTALQPDLYVDKQDDSVTVNIRCSNAGNVSSNITISIDNNVQQRSSVRLSFLMPSYTDTLLVIRYRLPLAVRQFSNAQLKISGLYPDGTTFATVLANIYNISSQQTYLVNNPVATPYNTNMVGLYARYIGSRYQYDELAADGDVTAPNSDLRYHINALYYPGMTGSDNRFMLINTYADYKNADGWGLKLGDIYDNLEVPISGRGLVASVKPGKHDELAVGYVNGNYNITGGGEQVDYKFSNTVYAVYKDTMTAQSSLKAQLIKAWDPQNQVSYNIGGGIVSMHDAANRQQFAFGGFASTNSTQHYVAGGQEQYGGAGYAQYSGLFQKWQLFSGNYLTSSKYAGLQKGAVNLEERLMCTPVKRWTAWVRYNQFSSDPVYLSPLYQLMNNSIYYMQTAELAVAHRLSNTLDITLKPYIFHEHTIQYFLLSSDSLDLQAARVNATANYTGLKNQLFTFNADAGAYRTDINTNTNNISWKINATYQFKGLTINAFAQNGPYYTADLSQYLFINRLYQIYSLNPSYNGVLFHRINLDISEYVAYEYAQKTWFNSFSINAGLSLPKNFMVQANYNLLQYGATQQLNAFDLGVVKKFNNPGTKNQLNSRLEIVFFEDKNGNGKLDDDERVAKSLLAKVNDQLFWTDENGKITYSQLPKGYYAVAVMNGNGYYANDMQIYVDGKTQQQIALHRMSMLKGKIHLTREAYSYESDGNLMGIKVKAIDKTGHSYTASVDGNGDFIFYLPENDYNVQIDTNSLPDKYECAQYAKSITVTSDATASIAFDAHVQQRQTKVVKFSSL